MHLDNTNWAQIQTIIEFAALLLALLTSTYSILQIRKSKEPMLTFRIKNYKNTLYLTIKNNGGSLAKDIKINFKKCNFDKIYYDTVFNNSIDLAPNEQITDKLCFLETSDRWYHTIILNYSYYKHHSLKEIKNTRTISYNVSKSRNRKSTKF